MLTLFRMGHRAVVGQVAAHPPLELAATVISVEEQLTGWYSQIRSNKPPADLARAYGRLAEAVRFYCGMQILDYTEAAILRYNALRVANLNVGGMDLRIAAIALENGAVVITRNVRDFERVPGLTIENWAA
jgi:tRNA(fMet)-specific endonuclease VapC